MVVFYTWPHKGKTFFLVLLLLFAGALGAQSHMDTVLIRSLIDSAWNIRFSDPSFSARVADQVIALSEGTYYRGMVNGYQLKGESGFETGQLDSAIYFYKLALQWSLRKGDHRETGNNFTALASIYQSAGDRDSSLYYYQQAVSLFQHQADSSALCDALLRYGNLYNDIGQPQHAIEKYLESIRYCEGSGRTDYLAFNYTAIGTIQDKLGKYDQAEVYYNMAMDKFREQHDSIGILSMFNNFGILYKNKKEYDNAIESYLSCLAISDTLHFPRGQMAAHTNLGILNVLKGNFENGLRHSQLGLALGEQMNEPENISDNLNWLARAQLGLHDTDKALQNARRALELGIEVKSIEKQIDANLTLSDIYHAMRDDDKSLSYYKTYSSLKDSLFNATTYNQIAEWQTIYETEKKDNEIQLLAKNAELDKARKTRLWLAFALSCLAGGLLVYSQWIRRTRDKKILSHAKELETQRAHNAELLAEKYSRELDFKKKELAAKALQLARKSEFLQNLHIEVDQIRDGNESHASEVARRISRQIRTDIDSDEEWDQFLGTFREVHQDFIDHLYADFPSISKSELRMACLMKMNLSAKDMAAMLNVTSDGIKKARYRLRKKMDLDSAVDLQDFLLSYPS